MRRSPRANPPPWKLRISGRAPGRSAAGRYTRTGMSPAGPPMAWSRTRVPGTTVPRILLAIALPGVGLACMARTSASVRAATEVRRSSHAHALILRSTGAMAPVIRPCQVACRSPGLGSAPRAAAGPHPPAAPAGRGDSGVLLDPSGYVRLGSAAEPGALRPLATDGGPVPGYPGPERALESYSYRFTSRKGFARAYWQGQVV